MSRKKKRKKQKLPSDNRGLIRRNIPSTKLPFDIHGELKKALQYHKSGQLQKAEEIHKRILNINPNHPDSLNLLGVIAHQTGKSDIAVNLISKAIQNNPESPVFHNNLGNVFKEQGNLSEAISCFRKALEIKPDYAVACYNQGCVFYDQGNLSEAISCYEKTLDIKPGYAEAYNNMGNAFKDQGNLSKAISCYEKALDIKPGYAEAYNNMGIAFKEQGKVSEAISSYEKALEINPGFAKAFNNMGNAFKAQEKLTEAISCYEKALDIKSDCAEAYSQLFHQLQWTCAWQRLEGMSDKLDGLTRKALDDGTKTAELPFIGLTRHADVSRHFAVSQSWSSYITGAMSSLQMPFSFDARRSRKTKITVGYLSNDFCNHVAAHLMLSLFGLHNRDEFEVFCYSYGEDDGSYYRERIQRDCDKFVDICNLNYTDAAKRIYEDQVDILVDLKGYTGGSRMEISALRPAPVQVRYLGLAGTTGADFFDYIITDRVVTPEDHAQYYSENFVYMPHSYQINDHTQAISNKDWKRADFGLPGDGFVFCSFNQAYKIEPVMFDKWMNILRQVTQSILWLQRINESAEKNLSREAEARGVEPERLIFSERISRAKHQARLRFADLALDTRIVNGAATTSDALWSGVPVITLQGGHFASRMSSSILTAIGLPELVTHSLEDYEALAVRLAHNPAELQTIQQRLDKNRLTEPLFDTPRFAGNLEKAYKEMWEIFLAGERPRKIEVTELNLRQTESNRCMSIGSADNKRLITGNILSNEFPFDIGNELNEALQYHQSGNLRKAEEIYTSILEIKPNHSDSLHLLGVIAHQSGKNEKAVSLINKAIQNNPESPFYYNNLGNVFKDQGKLNEAISCYEKALEIKPDYADSYNNMGNAFQDQGRLTEAISCYEKALEIKPDYAKAYNNMGNAFRGQGRLTEAISCYEKALEFKPGYVEAYNNMGNAFQDQGKLNEAISCYEKALEFKPDYVEAFNNMGSAFEGQGRLNKSISCYEKALEIKPDYADAHNNMGIAFQNQDKTEEAILCYQKALQLKPDYADACNHLVHQLQHTCAWQNIESLTTKHESLTKKALDNGTRTAESPFISLTRYTDLSRNFAVANSWSRDIAGAMSSLKMPFSFDDKRSRKRKITVGYLSNNFCRHTMAYLMLSLFGLHNRDEFEIFCYSYGKDDGSYYRERIQRDCDKFVDVRNLSYADAAKRIYEDQIDILVDLMGHTRGNRLEICALRPAPIQVRYLGLAGTSGADFFDYIITDRILTPEDHAQYYSENFVYMPHSYQVNDHTRAISNKDWKRADFGLPEDGFVFCSFNQAYKIEPVMFDKWMKILRQVPKGVLWLPRVSETAEDNLRQEAESRGVKPERLIFAEKLPQDEHLGRLRLADVALDTRIVNGAATTSDALWVGVPVITLQGGHFASRMSSSILTAIGLPELVTHSLEDYEALAVRLAHNPAELQTIKQRLAKNRLTEPLFDTLRFTGNLEKAYKEMWEIFVAGERPRQIEVRVALAKFQNDQGLFKVGGNLFRETGLSGDPITGRPGTSGLGSISPNSLEQSNVDIATEFVKMITTQRGFQANSKIITVTDQMLAELINIKR